MVLVERDAVIAQALQLDPGIEMLGIGLDRDRGIKMLFSHRKRQMPIGREVTEILAVLQKIEHEHFHRRFSFARLSRSPDRPSGSRSAPAYSFI